jgi:hypothetical protein
LILLIPVLIYLPFSEKDINPSTLSSSLSAETSVEQALSTGKDNTQVLPETPETKEDKRITEKQIEKYSVENASIATTKTTNNREQSDANKAKLIAINQPTHHTQMAASREVNENKVKDAVSFTPVIVTSDTAIANSFHQDATIITASAPLIPADTVELSSADENEKQTQKEKGSWRVSVAFAPQFITNTVKPLTNDEVFVTDINQITQTKPSGYGLAIGIGKAITPNFYIDGQLSYSFIEENIQFDYSDGTIDTLLTVEQPDKTYLVSPVYALENREVSSHYNYGGVRFGATYYFWSTPRTRFNMTATFGAHYLLSANVKAKVNGEWMAMSNENLNTINYSFSAGAGYNIMMGKGWELMINPMLTWYLREVKSQDVPYSVREEALGLNFMLSKTIGSK